MAIEYAELLAIPNNVISVPPTSTEVQYSTLPAHYCQVYHSSETWEDGGITYRPAVTFETKPYKIKGWHCVEWKDSIGDDWKQSLFFPPYHLRVNLPCIREEGYREDGVVVWRGVKR